tara:strand:- start:2558 stop:2992 length:435 start_codon:yes stop_codon:yes gene_type:complete
MEVNNNFFWYPALLFPAIPIMLLVFTQKYTALAMLIRKLNLIIKSNEFSSISLERIEVLAFRLILLRWMQTLTSISFLFNLATIFFSYIGDLHYTVNFFVLTVIFLIIAIFLFIIESQSSFYALSAHIKELKNHTRNKESKPPY